jgi:hypothetical protein
MIESHVQLSSKIHKLSRNNYLRKALHGGMSLPYAEFDVGDFGDRWSTERLCRHFKVVPGRYCSPPYPTQLEPSFHELEGIL